MSHPAFRRQVHQALALAQHTWDGGLGAPDPTPGERTATMDLLETAAGAARRRAIAPEIVLIVATDEAGGIGIGGEMPWHCPADLARFRRLTSGHLMVIGRKTHESIGRLLPGRTTAVLSRSATFDGALPLRDPGELGAITTALGSGHVFIAGGSEVYAAFRDVADRIERTVVSGTYRCDTRFPVDPEDGFTLARVRTAEDRGMGLRFETWFRDAG